MVRSILAAAGVLAVISTGALANPYDGSTTTKIIRTNPDTGHKTVIRKHVDRYGNMVIKKRSTTDGYGGSTTVIHRNAY